MRTGISITLKPAQWTFAMMAKVVDISASSVQRIWRAHGFQPHRVKQFKLSTDPQFVERVSGTMCKEVSVSLP
jgi:hypothetical protein